MITGDHMPTIYVTLPPDDPNFRQEDRRKLASFAEIVQHPGPGMPEDAEKSAVLAYVDAVIIGRGGGWLTDEMIESAPNLRCIGVIGGSVHRINARLALERGITIINTGWAMSNAVAEFSLAMMLCGLRDIGHMIDVMRDEGWGRARGGLDLTGKTVGLIGFGMIGRRVAELLVPFRTRTVVYDPFVADEQLTAAGVERVGLDDLLRMSSVVSLHLGLTDDTRGMIGPGELALIPDNGLIVNTARANIIDELALVGELQSGRLRAALNVFWKEPLVEDHPLRSLDNVILTPHGGGLTLDTRRRHSAGIVDDLSRFFAGEAPKSAVTVEMLEKMT